MAILMELPITDHGVISPHKPGQYLKEHRGARINGLLLLTGARKRELLDTKWENIDLARRLWFIPTTKTGKPRHAPLSQAAIDIIESLPRYNGCPWLAPHPDTLKPLVSIKNAWAYALNSELKLAIKLAGFANLPQITENT